MTTFSFSTTDVSNAERFLKHESFNYFNKEQKSFILSHLGEFRVCDPNLHSGGQISCTSEFLMIDLVKLGDVEEDSFMFNCSYLRLNLPLIKFGVEEKGFKPSQYSIGQVIKCGRKDILDYYLSKNLTTLENVKWNVDQAECSFEFFLQSYETVLKGQKPSHYRISENYSAEDLLVLADKKLFSVNSLKWGNNRDKYNKIVRIKKNRKK